MRRFVHFIKKIQQSDEATKRRWFVIFVVPAALATIISWGFILRADLTLDVSTERESSFRQFIEVFKRGAAIVGGRLADGVSRLTAAFREQLRYFKEVAPQEFKFTPEDLEPVNPKRHAQP